MNGAAAPRVERWREVDGIVLLDKPVGLSSNAALQRLRRIWRARKAGHTGSLDPLASGLLPICFGQATKICGMLLDADKTYLVTAALGARTATGDAEGEVVERAPVPALSQAEVERAAAGFRGESLQVPPMYSALKHAGQRLYQLARRGLEVERPPRRIVIHRLEIRLTGPDRLELEVECSKGTYVRTLVEDLARACGTQGYVAGLRRVSLGPFREPAMHTLADLEELGARSPAALDALLLPADAALPGLPAIALGVAEQAWVLQGQPVFVAGPPGERVRMYGTGGLFLGVGRMLADGRRLAPERIMVNLGVPGPVSA
ncbi:MAG: tRNA pseudouridine(55) synthase TruB [Gammaproteobacteria bacterium]|nr:MAG: tRNA pseudouridine(55) synthase TruB [Gammaproteobacteria bacterium]